jgi:high-affinity Fe2+/Pb2+ permease
MNGHKKGRPLIYALNPQRRFFFPLTGFFLLFALLGLVASVGAWRREASS